MDKIVFICTGNTCRFRRWRKGSSRALGGEEKTGLAALSAGYLGRPSGEQERVGRTPASRSDAQNLSARKPYFFRLGQVPPPLFPARPSLGDWRCR